MFLYLFAFEASGGVQHGENIYIAKPYVVLRPAGQLCRGTQVSSAGSTNPRRIP